MRYLLDTCVISEATKARPAHSVLAWLDGQEELSLYLSVITVGELNKGISKLPDGRKRRRLRRWVDHDLARRFEGRLLSIDLEVASCWGELSAMAEQAGAKIPVIDALLAATAKACGLTLVSRNTRHLQATGVAVVDPWAA